MIKWIFILSIQFPVLCAGQVQQTIEINGRVTDAETGKPLPGVNLFLDQTQKGTATDRNGNFEIRNVEPGNYTLVISMVGYEITHQSFSVPFSESQPLFISLTPIVTELSEVVVKAERTGRWLRNLRRFEQAFLGITENVSRTEIANPEILDFERHRGTLIASTQHNPLILINESLGYKIEFYLSRIEIKGDRTDAHGFAKYEELAPANDEQYKKWQKQRGEAYRGSFMHFVHALANHSTDKEGFTVFYTDSERDLFDRELLERFVRSQNMKDKINEPSQILASASVSGHIALVNRRSNYVGVIYTKSRVENSVKQYLKSDVDWQVSLIELPADTALIEVSSGNYTSPYRPVLRGYWGITSRLPDLLPGDFDASALGTGADHPVSEISFSETDRMLLKKSRDTLQESTESRLHEGLKAKENREYEWALAIWAEAMEVLPEAGYAIGREYVRLVAEQKMKRYYEQATSLYYRGLSNGLNRAVDQAALEKDLLYLELIMETEESDQIKLMNENGDAAGLLASVRRFWSLIDPTPLLVTNQRLIEHFARIHQAKERFTDPDSPLGFDDRGKIWVRYGEPDKTLDRQLRVRRGEIHGFVSDILFETGSEEVNSVSLNGPTAQLERRINSIPAPGNLDIWVYEKFNKDMNDKAIFYFQEGKSNSWNQMDSMDDWIPFGLYAPTKENTFAGVSVIQPSGVTPALVLQYLYYRQLTGFDPHFRTYFDRMDTEIFSSPDPYNFTESLPAFSSQFRAKNRHTAIRNTADAPSQRSVETEKIPSIPLDVHQYRLLDDMSNPVLATFVESRPAAAFLSDLTAGQEQMLPDEETDITDELSRWYTLRQGVDLLDETGRLAGRLRSHPELPLDEEDRMPATSLFTIPHLPDSTMQHFYVTLENHHPETSPPQESVFPHELRGLGRVKLPQPESLDLIGEGLILGDLIIGYGRMEQSESNLKFPFIVSHERTLPEGENLVVHFEAYRLQAGPQEFANFEVDYEIKPKQGLFGRLLKNKEKLNGTLEFEPQGSRFAESLEFEELNLEPGSYELHWTVRDVLSGEEAGQSVEFEVVEPE